MKIDTAFILAAGKGTRMGPVGEILAKPLWPIFKTTLLEIHVHYLQKVGVKKIFTNSHHNYQQVKAYIESKKIDVNVLYEPELLGVGGAIHNLSKELSGEKVLVVNSDIFLPLKEKDIESALSTMDTNKSVCHLFLTTVSKDAKYNETVLESERLVSIAKPSGNMDYNTYTGISIVDLSFLEFKNGASNFFESVADYKKSVVTAKNLSLEYWDFGTLENYFNSLSRIMIENDKGECSELCSFLREQGFIDTTFLL